jgi:hypothetical protein
LISLLVQSFQIAQSIKCIGQFVRIRVSEQSDGLNETRAFDGINDWQWFNKSNDQESSMNESTFNRLTSLLREKRNKKDSKFFNFFKLLLFCKLFFEYFE